MKDESKEIVFDKTSGLKNSIHTFEVLSNYYSQQKMSLTDERFAGVCASILNVMQKDAVPLLDEIDVCILKQPDSPYERAETIRVLMRCWRHREVLSEYANENENHAAIFDRIADTVSHWLMVTYRHEFEQTSSQSAAGELAVESEQQVGSSNEDEQSLQKSDAEALRKQQEEKSFMVRLLVTDVKLFEIDASFVELFIQRLSLAVNEPVLNTPFENKQTLLITRLLPLCAREKSGHPLLGRLLNAAPKLTKGQPGAKSFWQLIDSDMDCLNTLHQAILESDNIEHLFALATFYHNSTRQQYLHQVCAKCIDLVMLQGDIIEHLQERREQVRAIAKLVPKWVPKILFEGFSSLIAGTVIDESSVKSAKASFLLAFQDRTLIGDVLALQLHQATPNLMRDSQFRLLTRREELNLCDRVLFAECDRDNPLPVQCINYVRNWLTHCLDSNDKVVMASGLLAKYAENVHANPNEAIEFWLRVAHKPLAKSNLGRLYYAQENFEASAQFDYGPAHVHLMNLAESVDPIVDHACRAMLTEVKPQLAAGCEQLLEISQFKDAVLDSLTCYTSIIQALTQAVLTGQPEKELVKVLVAWQLTELFPSDKNFAASKDKQTFGMLFNRRQCDINPLPALAWLSLTGDEKARSTLITWLVAAPKLQTYVETCYAQLQQYRMAIPKVLLPDHLVNRVITESDTIAKKLDILRGEQSEGAIQQDDNNTANGHGDGDAVDDGDGTEGEKALAVIMEATEELAKLIDGSGRSASHEESDALETSLGSFTKM